MEKQVKTRLKAAVPETNCMEEMTTTASRAITDGIRFMADQGMTRSTAIEELIGSGATKEMIFFAVLVQAREQTMAAAESMEDPEMTRLQGPAKKTVFTVGLAMIH